MTTKKTAKKPTKSAKKPAKTGTKPRKTSKKTKEIAVKQDKTEKNLPAIPFEVPELTIENTDKHYHLRVYTEPQKMLDRMNQYFNNPDNKPFHIPGLRVALQIYSKETYELYSKSKEAPYCLYNSILTAGEAYIESGLVDRLFTARNWGAVQFYMKTEFGYNEVKEVAHSHSGSINISFTAESPEDKAKRLTLAEANKPQAIDVTPKGVKDKV